MLTEWLKVLSHFQVGMFFGKVDPEVMSELYNDSFFNRLVNILFFQTWIDVLKIHLSKTTWNESSNILTHNVIWTI